MKIFSKTLVIVTVICFMGISCVNEAGMDVDAAKVAAAKKALLIPAETDSDLVLPLVLDGVAISWVSSDEDVISNTGVVTRQPNDTEVTLTATLTYGRAVDTKKFPIRVPDYFDNIDDAINIFHSKEALKIPAETDCDIDLPLVLGSVAISWASSDEDVISNTGIVTRQPNDTEVTLTATLTLGNAVGTKEFTVRVAGYAYWNGTFFEAETELVEMIKVSGGATIRPWKIIMKDPNENIIYNFTVDNGYFSTVVNGVEQQSKNVSVHSGDNILWIDREIGGGQLLDFPYIQQFKVYPGSGSE